MNLTEGAGARMNHRVAIILATKRALCVLLLSQTSTTSATCSALSPVRIIFCESFGRAPACKGHRGERHLWDAISAAGLMNIFLPLESFFDLGQRSIRWKKKNDSGDSQILELESGANESILKFRQLISIFCSKKSLEYFKKKKKYCYKRINFLWYRKL